MPGQISRQIAPLSLFFLTKQDALEIFPLEALASKWINHEEKLWSAIHYVRILYHNEAGF
jgi:hypothetical protein